MESIISPSVRQRTASEMFPLVELWQTSGQTQKEFCQEQGLKAHVFTYWLAKYRKQQTGEEVPSGFVPIAIEEKGSQDYYAEIRYRDGTRLRFGQSVSAEQLRQLLCVSAT